ncbi:helix-turn-helix domain-containing protein [Caulobacter sp.]|uniref:helix-turn-helix domain-containing protein n=1 Tax=Caulobacter sp. TaxID=78 RepID=UPI003BB01F07
MSTSNISLSGVGAPAFPAGPMVQVLFDTLTRAERAFEIDPRQAKVFIRQASQLLKPELDGGKAREAGLAPWQERKVLRQVGERLDQPIRNQDLAELVGLSISHFGRRFKASFGMSPRDYLIRARVERAKTLMGSRDTPLSQIALDCGFCDQAHMCRLFRTVVGSTPSRWRREQTPLLEM